MSAFELDHAEDMKDPKYAYEFGRNEREAEIIKLLHEKAAVNWIEALEYPYYAEELEELIKGEK